MRSPLRRALGPIVVMSVVLAVLASCGGSDTATESTFSTPASEPTSTRPLSSTTEVTATTPKGSLTKAPTTTVAPTTASSAPTATPAPTASPAPTPAPTTPPTAPPPPPTTAPPPPPPPAVVIPSDLRAPSPEAPLRTMIVGDSTAFEVGHGVLRANGEGLLAPEMFHKTSSGLTRPDFFDWSAYLRGVADTTPPELMLLSLGANDAQAMTVGGAVYQVHDPAWRAEYFARVDHISHYLADRGTVVYWIGQPMAKSEGYSAGMSVINSVYAEVANNVANVEFVDIWPSLAGPSGEYVREKPSINGDIVVIRAADDIHLTGAGGDLAARMVWDHLRADWSS